MSSKRLKGFWVYFSETEHDFFMSRFNSSSCQTFSEYGRKVLLEKPVTLLFRNQSLDDTFEELVGIRKELKSIRQDLYAVVEQFTAGQGESQELKSVIIQEVQPSIEEIMKRIAKFSDIWYQSLEVPTA